MAKQIKQFLLDSQLGSEQSRQRSTGNGSGRITQVWITLIELFGAKVTKVYGEKPPLVWATMIDKLSDDQIETMMNNVIKKSIEDFRHKGESWPPSLPELIAHANPVRQPSHIEHKPNPRFGLPVLRAQKDVANKNLEEIRKTLRGKKHEANE